MRGRLTRPPVAARAANRGFRDAGRVVTIKFKKRGDAALAFGNSSWGVVERHAPEPRQPIRFRKLRPNFWVTVPQNLWRFDPVVVDVKFWRLHPAVFLLQDGRGWITLLLILIGDGFTYEADSIVTRGGPAPSARPLGMGDPR